MKKKVLPLFLVMFIFPLLTLGLGNCDTSTAKVPFNYDELTASVYMNSPIENGTYTVSDIDVKVYIHAGSHEPEPGVHYIPYQDISCLYSLDGGEWQNMSLSFVKVHEPFCSMANPFYYCTVDLNYTGTLYNVSEGAHQLRFSVTPLEISCVSFVHHPASADASEHFRDYFDFTVAVQNPSVINETIAESSSNGIIGNASGVTLPTAELFTLLVIASFSGAITILAVVMRKRTHL